MNAKGWAKPAKVGSRWSLPPAIGQPGSADRRDAISAAASLLGRAIGSAGRHGHDGRALDVLVADLGDVEGLDVVDELPERLLEAGEGLALPGERRGAGEDEGLDVRVADPALLDPGYRPDQGLVGLPHERGPLLPLLERLREVALQELVHPAQDPRERAAREALVLLVEHAQGYEVGRLELEGGALLALARRLVHEAA